MFQLEQDEGGAGDSGDPAEVEADAAQGLEGDLEQGVGPLGDAVNATDDLVGGLLGFVEFSACRRSHWASRAGHGAAARSP